MRVFLDTNVLFSGLYSFRGHPSTIVDLATSGRIEVVTSVDVLVELTRNLRLKAPHMLAGVSSFLTSAQPEFVNPDPAEVQRLHNQGFGTDAPIVAAAAGAEVDYFCSGDRRLLERVRRARLDLRAASPAELLSLLE